MDMDKTPKQGMDRQKGVPAPAHGTPEPPKQALDNTLSAVGGADAGAIPPPPGEQTPEGGSAPEAPARTKTPVTQNQLDAIRDIKANPETREAWYASLDAAMKAGEIKVKSVVTTLKTKPEDLSLAAASAMLKYAPMRNPDDPATPEQVEAATLALQHVVQSQALGDKVKAADPDLYEKAMAHGAAALTKREASNLIGFERNYNKEMAARPATQDQLRAVEEILAKQPAILEKVSASFKEAHEKGTLTHGDVQYFFRKNNELAKAENAVVLGEAVEILKGLSAEDRVKVAEATLSRIEEAAGKTFKEEAIKYVTQRVHDLVEEGVSDEARKAAEEYFLGFQNAQALKDSASALVQV